MPLASVLCSDLNNSSCNFYLMDSFMDIVVSLFHTSFILKHNSMCGHPHSITTLSPIQSSLTHRSSRFPSEHPSLLHHHTWRFLKSSSSTLLLPPSLSCWPNGPQQTEPGSTSHARRIGGLANGRPGLQRATRIKGGHSDNLAVRSLNWSIFSVSTVSIFVS